MGNTSSKNDESIITGQDTGLTPKTPNRTLDSRDNDSFFQQIGQNTHNTTASTRSSRVENKSVHGTPIS